MQEELKRIEKYRWEIRLYGNNSLVNSVKSQHFNIYDWSLASDFPDYTPCFESPHVNVLSNDQVDRAYIRIQCILRLVSGLRIVCDKQKVVASDNDITLVEGIYFKKMRAKENLDIILEELENPFDEKVASLLCSSNVSHHGSEEEDFFNIIVRDSSVREAITLFALGEEQVLYFLINAYKILEIIKGEYKLKNRSNKLCRDMNSKPIPDYLLDPLNEFQGFSRYINSKDGSGIFSRHGSKDSFQKNQKPSHAKMREVLILAIKSWLKHKSEILYNRNYISKS